jgi:hypothetical protein
VFSRDLIKPQGTVDKPQIVVKEATKIDKKSFQNKVVADNEKSSKPGML